VFAFYVLKGSLYFTNSALGFNVTAKNDVSALTFFWYSKTASYRISTALEMHATLSMQNKLYDLAI